MQSTCAKCGLPILLLPSLRGGLVALDAEPIEAGTVAGTSVIVDGHAWAMHGLPVDAVLSLPLHTNHLETCPGKRATS